MPAATLLSSKILVTNRAALNAKYRALGVKAIETAVRRMVRADARRGFATRLIYLDSGALGRARVRDPTDPVQNKAAIDAVARRHRPEYMVILGSHDVVPYQDLKNKLYDPGDSDSDPDRFAPGDLPYACEAPYSQDVAKFLGPTRVLGRLPDLTGARTPTYLIRLLAASIAAKGMTAPTTAFAISARVWKRSTEKSVRNILGAVPVVLTSPTKGPRFASKMLRQKVHLVNCHGDEFEHRFSGEGPKDTYFTAMDSRKLTGVGSGSVAAFECCFGAQLYDPKGLPAMSIANTYLRKRAAAVVASTTIAYGLEDSNANADVLCQLFIEQVLRGASLGRAFLEARLDYVRQQSVADPYDEKTLAQFVLLGDPSLHPFPASPVSGRKKSRTARAAEHAARLQRRVRLMKAGAQLSRQTAYTVLSTRPARPAMSASKVIAAARRRFTRIRRFEVREPAAARQVTGKAFSAMPKARHVFVATRRRPRSRTQTPRIDGLLVYEVNGSVVEINLVSR